MKIIEDNEVYASLTYLGDAENRIWGKTTAHYIHVRCECGREYELARTAWRYIKHCVNCENKNNSNKKAAMDRRNKQKDNK